jgi:cell division septum initiation protein DivIVA
MSAISQILDQVEQKVRDLLVNFVKKNEQQDKRLDAIEERLNALESATGGATARKATTAKPPAAGASAKASGAK